MAQELLVRLDKETTVEMDLQAVALLGVEVEVELVGLDTALTNWDFGEGLLVMDFKLFGLIPQLGLLVVELLLGTQMV
jgi:hypothetical protein